jgi:hypothetical protein
MKIMRCQEVLDQLPLLIYDELSAAEATACRQHLDACSTCRAELAAFGQVRTALDQVPHRQVQVDLAGVCLRIVARQHRERVWRRAAVGITAVAAAVLALASLRLLHIAIEPGRVTLAWSAEAPQHAPDRLPLEDGESAIVDASPATESGPSVVETPYDRDRMFTEAPFDVARVGGFAASRNILPGQFEALRYAQPAQSPSAPQRPAKSYHDLRLELLAPQEHMSATGETPDA